MNKVREALFSSKFPKMGEKNPEAQNAQFSVYEPCLHYPPLSKKVGMTY